MAEGRVAACFLKGAGGRERAPALQLVAGAGVAGLVERFDIEAYSDFSSK